MTERMTEAEIADLLIRRVGRNGRCEVLCTKAHAEIERLREALEDLADLPPGWGDMDPERLVINQAAKAQTALHPAPIQKEEK